MATPKGRLSTQLNRVVRRCGDAKQSGRTAFTAMLEYLKRHRPTCGAILVGKIV